MALKNMNKEIEREQEKNENYEVPNERSRISIFNDTPRFKKSVKLTLPKSLKT